MDPKGPKELNELLDPDELMESKEPMELKDPKELKESDPKDGNLQTHLQRACQLIVRTILG